MCTLVALSQRHSKDPEVLPSSNEGIDQTSDMIRTLENQISLQIRHDIQVCRDHSTYKKACVT